MKNVLFAAAAAWVPSISTANVYFATYALGSIDKLSVINLVAAIGGPVSLLALPAAKKIGKRKVYVYGMIVGGLGCLVRLIAVNSQTSGLVAACVSTMIFNSGISFAQLLYYSIQADNIDYIDYKLGLRAEGIIAASTSMLTKICNGLGGAFTLYVLSWTANSDGSYSTLGLSLVDGILPAVLMTVGAIVFFLLYRIENSDVQEMQAVLAERRRKIQDEA